MTQTEVNDISIDSSLLDPEQDLLGYASFAKYLADSICRMDVPESFVIAVYGSWNSGKSTLLNFLVDYLKQKPSEEQPIIIPFNPWLFSGYQDITRRFFEQLHNVLSQVTPVSKGLKDRLADFANLISETPIPYAKAGKAVATFLNEDNKEASELKEEVEDKLVEYQHRIVVTIDDIDRLPAKDIMQLFRIFNAIPNFNNVIYVLVCDREVVSKTIADSKEISKEVGLEKIVNVAFDLPTPDKISLRRLLFKKLENIFCDLETQNFNQIRWRDLYFQGIDHFINSIRDIVSFTNTLTVNYPAVQGEVNPIDFLALESLRVFCPTIYSIISQNPEIFLGELQLSEDKLQSLLDTWMAQLPDDEKQPIQSILIHLFPKVQSIWSNRYFYAEQESEWREQLRICSLEIFPVYFRLTLSTGELANTQIKAIFGLAKDGDKLKDYLIKLAQQKRLDGTTQARAFLEKLEDYNEQDIPVNYIPSIIEALLALSEQLSFSQDDESKSIFDFGDEIIISREIKRLLCQTYETLRFEILKKSITQGQGLAIINELIATLKEQQHQSNQQEWLVNSKHLQELEEAIAKNNN